MGLRDWVAGRWWAGQGGLPGAVLDVALLPAEGAFRLVVRGRNALYDRGMRHVDRVAVPVVSVGNLAVGGAGKTPFSAWLVALLRSWGRRPGIAVSGYGEDEVLLHREMNRGTPVLAARRRIEAARAAVEAGCDVVVLDDAFQHRALARDLDVVLVAAEGWSARRRTLPRGPWREDVDALGRADVVVVTRKSASVDRSAAVAADLRRLAPGLPIVECALRPTGLRRIADDPSSFDGIDGIRRINGIEAVDGIDRIGRINGIEPADGIEAVDGIDGIEAADGISGLVEIDRDADADREKGVATNVDGAPSSDLPPSPADQAGIGLDALRGRDVLAVAALADPRPFFAHLEEHGARVERSAWPDHHAFTAAKAADLEARANGRAMVMTHKDAVKLRPLLSPGTEAYVLEQRVEVGPGREALEAALRGALARGGRA